MTETPGEPEGWFEVWWDYTSRPPYLLLLLGGRRPDVFEVWDPVEKRFPHRASSYVDATLWLSEDEFTRVDGRVSLDDD